MALRDELQTSLGATYALERELGGGGMSRVFVARDTTLNREVAVKVLPEELAASVNVDRFRREILLAAALQHPNIVPVLSAGETNALPYYTMPFVHGESLRARLSRGPMAVGDTVSMLREVARALSYAHERGVVHRDIKPDNILISGGSAVVADFGIAKALSAARMVAPGATLTQIGTSIGTPAYMAPEQAAGDPDTDHRADIYALGCLAYEALTGRPPFVDKSPHRLLTAHMTETPQPVSALRADTPAALSDLIARMLEKSPDKRPQSADDVVRVLDVATSGSAQPAMPAVLLGGRGMLRRALLLYAGAFVVVAIVAKAAIVGVGLPDWVFPGALVVMALGLPVILFTAYTHYATRRILTTTPTFTPGGTPSLAHGTMATIAFKASPHVSWRRTAMGGAFAFGGFIVLIGGYMLMRTMGIGPAASLFASGALAEHEKLLVGDFPNPAGDSVLGPVVTEAFRTALAQSQSVEVLQQAAMRDALRRMQRPADAHVDFNLAREIATREGIRAVIDGNLIGIGGRYAVSVKLMSPTSGEVLAQFSENANSQADILPAIDKLAKEVRAKMGESLKRVQKAPPLEQVTTPSLEALKKYVAGSRIFTQGGDFNKGAPLLAQAIALDTGFAMAYRRLAVWYSNQGAVSRAGELMDQAYAHRDRLSEAERLLVTGSYFQNGHHQDFVKSKAAYEELLEVQPNNVSALNNLALLCAADGNDQRATELLRRAIEVGPVSGSFYQNLALSQARLGQNAAAMQTVDEFDKRFPGNPKVPESRGYLLIAQQQYDTARAVLADIRTRFPSDAAVQAEAGRNMAWIAAAQGRINDASQEWSNAWRPGGAVVPTEGAVMAAAAHAQLALWFAGDTVRALSALDDTLARFPLDSIPDITIAYSEVEWVYAMAHRPDKARAVLAKFEASRKRFSTGSDSLIRAEMLGNLDMSEKKYDAAVGHYRASISPDCAACSLPMLGIAFDLAGKPDSALAVFNRYFDRPDPFRDAGDARFLAGAHKRAGELYEARGDKANAIAHYTRFIELWKHADPMLQPKVAEVKAKLARLGKSAG